LQQRTLLASDLPGFKVDIPPEIFPSTDTWLKVKDSGQYKESAALQARGFVAAAREHLYLTTKAGLYAADATSAVIEFKSRQGALATLSEIIPSGNAGMKPFTVPGIPGARGAAIAGVNSNGFAIGFVDGRYSYLVGVLYPPNSAKHPTRASVVAAAQALYRRVHRA